MLSTCVPRGAAGAIAGAAGAAGGAAGLSAVVKFFWFFVFWRGLMEGDPPAPPAARFVSQVWRVFAAGCELVLSPCSRRSRYVVCGSVVCSGGSVVLSCGLRSLHHHKSQGSSKAFLTMGQAYVH